jgi:hypothetical protein
MSKHDRPVISFAQLCLVTKEQRPSGAIDWVDWKYRVMDRCTALGYQAPASTQVWRAMEAVTAVALKLATGSPYGLPRRSRPKPWSPSQK